MGVYSCLAKYFFIKHFYNRVDPRAVKATRASADFPASAPRRFISHFLLFNNFSLYSILDPFPQKTFLNVLRTSGLDGVYARAGEKIEKRKRKEEKKGKERKRKAKKKRKKEEKKKGI